METSDLIIPKSPIYNITSPGPDKYIRMPVSNNTYLAYVVAIKDPLNLHLDLYLPREIEEKYSSASKYPYEFYSEELKTGIHTRTAYYCHLKGIEIYNPTPEDFSNMKEAYIIMTTKIAQSNGWVLVSLSDIDVYKRILVNVFDLIDRSSLNVTLLKTNSKSGTPIAKEYCRPVKTRTNFCATSNQKDYHLVYDK